MTNETIILTETIKTNEELGIQSYVIYSNRRDQYGVILKDIDSGEIVPVINFYNDKLVAIEKAANAIK
jgi:hypothetical protein